VITGETGVGKSLLLDAVGFLLGERRTNFPIRSGSTRAVIEAEFDAQADQALRRWLSQNDFSSDMPVILRREFLPNNRTRLFINDSPATLQQSGPWVTCYWICMVNMRLSLSSIEHDSSNFWMNSAASPKS